jgi:hypothetical protein
LIGCKYSYSLFFEENILTHFVKKKNINIVFEESIIINILIRFIENKIDILHIGLL